MDMGTGAPSSLLLDTKAPPMMPRGATPPASIFTQDVRVPSRSIEDENPLLAWIFAHTEFAEKYVI